MLMQAVHHGPPYAAKLESGVKIDVWYSSEERLGFVWNREDALTLRTRCRIVGALIGSLAKAPRQNAFFDLPLVLTPEEIHVAQCQRWIRLLDSTVLADRPTIDMAQAFAQFRRSSFEQQVEAFRQLRIRQVESHLDAIVEGRRAKLRSAGHAHLADQLEPSQVLLDELRNVSHIGPLQQLIQLFAEHPWLSEQHKRPLPDLTFDNESRIQRVKRLAFQQLWLRGFHLTAGDNFGGDFLAYPGHPSLYHSQFVVMCLEHEPALLSHQDLVARGRLGTSVRKTVVLAYLGADSSQEHVLFQAVKSVRIKRPK